MLSSLKLPDSLHVDSSEKSFWRFPSQFKGVATQERAYKGEQIPGKSPMLVSISVVPRLFKQNLNGRGSEAMSSSCSDNNGLLSEDQSDNNFLDMVWKI